jgi:ribosomal protein S18 acetylase RimI-like enzyme
VPDIDVRFAQKADVRALSRTLGRAFHDDPIMKWMLPDDARRAKALPRMWATMARHHYLACGGAEIATNGGGAEIATNGPEVGAATLWDPPGRWKQTPREELRMAPAFLLAFRSKMAGAQKIADIMKEKHPEEPHWYLFAIGSDPTVRGAGFGQALMRCRLDRCDAEHAPAYLESTKEETVPYYMRFGFEVMGELKLPGGCPSMWPMWRAAR